MSKNPQQRTPEWFAAREGRVTGSSVGAILGVNPYTTRDDVMRRMVRDYHKMPSEFTGNVATEYGSHHEAGALIEYEMETGNAVTQVGFAIYDDWLGASPDGLVGDAGLVEIKCPYGLRNGGEFKAAAEQPHYVAQMQIQMFVTGSEWCDFFQWSPHGTKLERVEFDGPLVKQWLLHLKEFHDDYLFVREHDYERHINDLRPELNASQLIAEYDDMTKQIEEAEARKKEILTKIVNIAGHKDSIVNGRKLTLVKKDGAVSYSKAIKALLPDADLEPYRGKPTEYWMLGK
jgi:putative phage-type endonuclease